MPKKARCKIGPGDKVVCVKAPRTNKENPPVIGEECEVTGVQEEPLVTWLRLKGLEREYNSALFKVAT